MAYDPFRALSVSPAASSREIKLAFRRLAMLHHPDRNPGDRGATRRFERLLRAYRDALAARRDSRPAPRARGPRPDRYGCGRCGDAFPFPESCPRCDLPLSDQTLGPAVAPEDARVTRFVERLESRPEPTPGWDERLPVPGLVIAGSVLLAFATWRAGPVGPALLLVGFAAYVAAVELHRRVQGPLG